MKLLIQRLLSPRYIGFTIGATVLVFGGVGVAAYFALQPKASESSEVAQSDDETQTNNDSQSFGTGKSDSAKKTDGSSKTTKPKTTTPSGSSGQASGGSTGTSSNTGSGSSSSPSPSTTTPGGTNTGGFQANCITSPHVCGYPDETNTGVKPGVSLTTVSTYTADDDGEVVQNLLITEQLRIRANNVTVRNVRISTNTYYPIDYSGNSYTGLVVEDSEIIGTSSAVTAGMSFTNYTARRVEVYGTADGFKADQNVIIQDSYIHNLRVTSSSHNDGIQATGGSNVQVRHNTFKMSGTSNEIMQFNGTNSGWTIENNLIDGGGWVFNASSLNGTAIRSNRFTRTQGYGILTIPGATYTGNYYDNDGTPAILK